MRLMLCNCPPASAEPLARALVETNLAACVNISAPIKSVYRWKGALEVDDEVTLVIKLPVEHVDAARELLLKQHPYELPEVLVLEVDTARSNPAYVSWVRELVSA